MEEFVSNYRMFDKKYSDCHFTYNILNYKSKFCEWVMNESENYLNDTDMDKARNSFKNNDIKILRNLVQKAKYNAFTKCGNIKDKNQILKVINTTLINIDTIYHEKNNFSDLSTDYARNAGILASNDTDTIDVEAIDSMSTGDNKAFVLKITDLDKDVCYELAKDIEPNDFNWADFKFSIEDDDTCSCTNNRCEYSIKGNKSVFKHDIIFYVDTVSSNLRYVFASQNDYRGLTTDLAYNIGALPRDFKGDVEIESVGNHSKFMIKIKDIHKEVCDDAVSFIEDSAYCSCVGNQCDLSVIGR